MAEVQAVSPVGSRGFTEPRPPSQTGSQSSSRVGFVESPRPHGRHGSEGRMKYPSIPRPPSNQRSTPSIDRPASIRSLREKKELNEYLSPIVKTAVRRWKRFHEQKVIERFKQRKQEKKKRIESIKEEKQRLARCIPIDTLAVDWLNKNDMTVDARAYLLDKLLPTLIMGIEKLLMEAEKRELTENNDGCKNFNPLNFLAQYLMRNNPRYSNFPEASPYIRGLQEVTDELKKYVFSFEDNRLARVKAEARRKREQMERTETLKSQERDRRSAQIQRHYMDWLLEEDGLVEQRALQNSLRSFSEVLENLPDEFKKASDFMAELETLEATEQKLDEAEFAQYLKQHILKLGPDIYESLMQHMKQCAIAYRHAAVLEARRDILIELFTNCDHADVGIINRHRVLGLFENFWETAPWTIKRHLRNPQKWPVIELHETEDTESIASDGSTSFSSVKEDVAGSVDGSMVEVTDQEDTKADGGEVVKQEDGDEEKNEEVVAVPVEKEVKGDGEVEKDNGGDVAKGAGESQEVASAPADGAEISTDASKDEVKQDATTAGEGTGECSKEGDGNAGGETAEGGERVVDTEGGNEETKEEGSSKDGVKPVDRQETTAEEKKGDEIEIDGERKENSNTAVCEDKQDVAETGKDTVDEKKEEDNVKSQSEVQDGEAVAGESQEASNNEDYQMPAEGKKDDAEEEKTTDDVTSGEASQGELQQETRAEQDGSEQVVAATEGVAIEATTTDQEESESKEATETAGEEIKEGADLEGKKLEPGEESKEDTTAPSDREKQTPAKDTAESAPQPENAQPGQETNGKEAGAAETDKKKTVDEANVAEVEEEQVDGDKVQELMPESAKDGPVLHPATANTITGRSTSVSFHEDAIRMKEEKSADDRPKTPVKTPTARSGSRAGSAFDENALNGSQFVQLVELFLEKDSPQFVVQQLINFIMAGYVETEQEKFLRLQKARREALSAKRRQMLDQLFDKWDNDGSGFLDLEEFHQIMAKFKDNMETKIMAKAKQKMAKEELDNRLSKSEFKAYIEAVCSLLPGGEDNFDPLVEFLMTSVERSYEERIRGQARKKWLAMIIQSAETSAGSMQPVYKSIFNCLYKDADQHGRGKCISANVAMLERNDSSPSRGATCLRYVAATPDDAAFMLNKILYRDMRGISFSSIDSGKPIHVPRVQNHGNIMFWNPERADEERQGSFIVIPLKDFRKRVFGTMSIDTLNDPQDKSIFITHEISFFQGVAKAFATAYQYVDVRRKTLRIAESAVSWIHRRSPHVVEVNVYMVEPDDKVDDFVLRKMITTDKKGSITIHDRPPRLERKENLFRDYLFKCVDNSETVAADAYGQRHLAFPLRDVEGRALALVDLSIGDLKQLPNHENKEVQRMLKLLQAAHKEVSQESAGADKNIVLEAEKGSEESRIDIMFDRIMLTDLRDTVSQLNMRAFAELKSYKDPPKVIHDILVSVLALFFQDKYEEGELDAWNMCKQFVGPELIKKIEEFDPTATTATGVIEVIASRLRDVPHGAVAKHGSLPAQNLYNWAFVCLSLLEHTSKMTKSVNPGVIAPPGSATSGDVGAAEQ